MQFWRKIRQNLVGAGGGSQNQQDDGLYFYVRLYKNTQSASTEDEIVRLRLNRQNDLSLDDEGKRFAHKTVVGNQTFRRAELTLYFDSHLRATDHEISGGELTTEQAYQDYLGGQSSS